jgi:hypothetical protein
MIFRRYGGFSAGKCISGVTLLLLFAFRTFAAAPVLPSRLVLLLDGVAYRDMVALQLGVTYKLHGHQVHRQAFTDGYFPVSRLISTFPSISDPSWSEIMDDQPPPGYQRTYFDAGTNREISVNGVTSSDDYEREMTWQMSGGFHRTMGYVAPQWAFDYEVKSIVQDFLNTHDGSQNFYALVHSTDSAQHLSGNIFEMLTTLDAQLQQLRAYYRASQGKELQIILLSDHGNNHAGGGKRVAVKPFLKKAGYHITKSPKNTNDIDLPTAGVESWIEIHNSPSQTEKLVPLLTHLEGVDVVTGQLPGNTNRFLVMNSKGERATIDWNPARNSYRYTAAQGDPLEYRPVVEALAQKNALDADGFATSDAWMAETLSLHYPVALERIVRGHTHVAQNPANVIVSLKNGYVHSGWLIKRGLALTKSGGTHGALDSLNSDGILLTTFKPTEDTTTSRVAFEFDQFPGRRDLRNIATAPPANHTTFSQSKPTRYGGRTPLATAAPAH